ncbi:MAG: CBS domain-containing protein [Deltaproteobacteria bacterium]|nr:CBS domain-containing protein [Deltaproteobacteria bacterium]
MGTVRNILAGKDKDSILTTTEERTVYEAIAFMAENRVGALVVVQAAAVVGMITERDYLRKVALQGRSSKETPVSAIMSSPVVTVSSTDTVDHCMALMTENRCRHLPVVTAGRLVGLISIGDCVKQVVREQKEEIGFLEDYIGGRS